MKNECEPFEGWKQPEDEKEERRRERYLCVHDVRVSLCVCVATCVRVPTCVCVPTCVRVCRRERE